MRKNSPRKWLHAILDLLPVILIPVFMIYSHRHTIDSYSVTRQERENQPYNFYQGVENGKPNSLTGWSANGNGSSIWYSNGEIHIIGDVTIDLNGGLNIDLNNGTNYYYFSMEVNNSGWYDLLESVYLINEDEQVEVLLYDEETLSNDINNIKVKVEYTSVSQNILLNNIFINFYESNDSDFEITMKNIQVFNLTSIFGSGNEPTIEEFESMLTQDYYNYGNNYVDNYVMVSKTYNDTDIMSQFTYNLYNSVDKYFNMNNVFGMNNVYSWFETNIFHGTAPLYIYIVWNIVLYEFVMDLLMLLYSLFMWFIDICQNLIDRCYSSSNGGN